MLKPTGFGFLVVLLFSNMQLARGQTNVDDLRSNWPLGDVRGSIHLRIPNEEKQKFMIFLEDFTKQRFFVKISSADRPVLSGREFVSEWYRRPDGVTILVTDITAPEKMRVIFYDRKDGRGGAEAKQAFGEFQALSSGFRKYE